MKKRIAVSIFSGAGGLDLGFEYAGFFIPVAVDNNRQAVYTYAQNHGAKIIDTKTSVKDLEPGQSIIVFGDIRDVTGDFILALCEKIAGTRQIDVLIGGPSCQSWSVAGNLLGDKDERGRMIYEYLRLLKEISPQAFIFENVKGIISKKFIATFKNLVSEFEKLGYCVSYRLLNSFDYGVAQTRERVIVAGLKNREYTFPPPLPYKLVLRDVIGDLPEPQVYRKDAPENAFYSVPSKILGFKGEKIVFGDQVELTSREIGIRVIKEGLVRNPRKCGFKNHLYFDNISASSFESSNRPIFIEKPSPTITAHSRCTHILFNHQAKDFGFSSRYLSRNRQRQWDEAGFTVVGDGRQQALHPEPANFDIKNMKEGMPVPRRLTVRECLRIQGFPDWFVVYGSLSAQYMQVGNAVPVILSYCLARQLGKQLP